MGLREGQDAGCTEEGHLVPVPLRAGFLEEEAIVNVEDLMCYGGVQDSKRQVGLIQYLLPQLEASAVGQTEAQDKRIPPSLAARRSCPYRAGHGLCTAVRTINKPLLS